MTFTRDPEQAVGPIYTVSPRESKRYFLKTLLHQVTGANSFKEMRTVEGIVYATYRQTCLELGLLSNDTELWRSLTDAFESSFQP